MILQSPLFTKDKHDCTVSPYIRSVQFKTLSLKKEREENEKRTNVKKVREEIRTPSARKKVKKDLVGS